MIIALVKSAVSGVLVTLLFVWAFGMPATWGTILFWTFVSLLTLIVTATFVTVLKWAIILAAISDIFDE